MADLLAELAGYQAELAYCEKNSRDERAGLVRDQIDRVVGEVRDQVARLRAHAEACAANGQDVPAAEAVVEARRLEEALPAEQPKRGPGRPRKETAQDKTPKERA